MSRLDRLLADRSLAGRMRLVLVVACAIPYALWYWPQWAARDFATGFIRGRL